MKYRKKPIVIDAIQYTGKNVNEIVLFTGKHNIDYGDHLRIKTLEGTMTANIGDYIIKGVSGEFYPCKPYIFEQTYEKAIGVMINEQLIRHWLREASDMGRRGFSFDYDERFSEIPDEWVCFENMAIKDIEESNVYYS